MLTQAAVKVGCVIFTGWRHNQCLIKANNSGAIDTDFKEFGYITEDGKFVDLQTAAEIMVSEKFIENPQDLKIDELWQADGKPVDRRI